MVQKMTRKLTLLFALSCIFSLGVGVLLGYGIQTQGLMGTALPPVIVDNNSNDISIMVLDILFKHTDDYDRGIREKLVLIDSINKKIEEINQGKSGENPEDIEALYSERQTLMNEAQDLSNKRNEYMEIFNDFLNKRITAEDAIIRLQ